MNDINETLQIANYEIITAIQNLLAQKSPIVVALDGGSGAGKSTLSALIEGEYEIALIPLDDFFSADIPDRQWDKFSVGEKLKNVFNWKKLRECAIEPLLKGNCAKWYPFDFESKRPDGTFQLQTNRIEQKPSNVILIDGAYSASPEIANLIDLTILVDVPIEERHKRLNVREKDKDFLEQWHKRWGEVEAYYFTQIRPENSFDLIVKLL